MHRNVGVCPKSNHTTQESSNNTNVENDVVKDEPRLWMLYVWSILLCIILDFAFCHDGVNTTSPQILLQKQEFSSSPRNHFDAGTKGIEPGVEREARLAGADPAKAPPETSRSEVSFHELAGFKNSWDPRVPDDHPVFWHVAKSGGTTLKEILSSCFKFVLATDMGIRGHEHETELAIVDDNYGNRFVNVDTTTLAGIARAKQLDYVSSNLAQITSTPLISDIESMFSEARAGRVFAIFRHPIERSVSLFNYLQYADWEPTYNPELAQMTLEQYARSPYMENNFLTRSLTNTWEGELNSKHVEVALDFMRRKILVGLMTEFDASVLRFEKYFGWKFTENPEGQEGCRETLIGMGINKNKEKTVMPEEGSAEHEVLTWENMYDLALYKYATQLFVEQAVLVSGVPDDSRLAGATVQARPEPGGFLRGES